LIAITLNAYGLSHDSIEVIKLNKQAYDNRLTNPDEVIKQAKKSLEIANQINFTNGIAEANRILGIGYYYKNDQESALKNYLEAIKYFHTSNNLAGEAKVDNNIGNLYRESDYDEAIKYYDQALAIAIKIKDEEQIATIYLNYGNIFYRKKKYNLALDYSGKSSVIFTKLHNTVNMIQCLQNTGVIYFWMKQLDTAKVLLLKANKQAKAKDLNLAVASINLTLTNIFMVKNQLDEAQIYLDEGLKYAQLVNSEKLQYDYKMINYQLEAKRKNYQGALGMLYEIYKTDSTNNKNSVPTRLKLYQIQTAQIENQHKQEMLQAERKNDQIFFWATVVVAVLLVVVVVLLINNVNRKAKTNKDLTGLNQKITEQKENLNQINHHLEEIIDDRTKDLQIKNKKLADYSLHLSHQIRGPIATLKGLLNLEKDNLIEKDECIKLMNKCVSEIDDNIIDMSGMLHETTKKV
jgi:tetratricopeptide (TPR) repeat protein